MTPEGPEQRSPSTGSGEPASKGRGLIDHGTEYPGQPEPQPRGEVTEEFRDRGVTEADPLGPQLLCPQTPLSLRVQQDSAFVPGSTLSQRQTKHRAGAGQDNGGRIIWRTSIRVERFHAASALPPLAWEIFSRIEDFLILCHEFLMSDSSRNLTQLI